MPSTTYFVFLPFGNDEEGQFCADEAIGRQSSTGAAARARALAKAGAVAFSLTGDPETGDWGDGVLLLRIGETPADHEAVSG